MGGDLSITECPNPPMVYPLDVVQSFPECTLCEGARCVPTTLVPAEQQTLLATCDATNSCVPEGYATSGGSFLAKTCTSLEYQPGMAAEGRCISVCVPAVAAQVDQLPLDTCASGEKCAPCWEPIDGALTGACGIACDTWTQGAVERFTECGANPLDATDPKRGVCVPPELVPAELLNAVPPETCTGGWLCAPKEKARDLTMKFPTCVPGGAAALLVQNGACVPAYLVPADQVPLIGPLGTAPCAQDEYCAPCTNPLVIDPATMLPEVTGACN